MRMLCWIFGWVVRLDMIGLWMTILENWGYTNSRNDGGNYRLKWFENIERRSVDFAVKRVGQIEGRQTVGGRGRPVKTVI